MTIDAGAQGKVIAALLERLEAMSEELRLARAEAAHHAEMWAR